MSDDLDPYRELNPDPVTDSAWGRLIVESTGGDPGPADLLGQLVEAQQRATERATTSLFDHYERRIAELQAERDLIRERVEWLCSQPWTPNPREVLDALYPTSAAVRCLAERPGAES